MKITTIDEAREAVNGIVDSKLGLEGIPAPRCIDALAELLVRVSAPPQEVWVLEALISYEPGYLVKATAKPDLEGFQPSVSELGDREDRSGGTWLAFSERWCRWEPHAHADEAWALLVARLGAGDPQDATALRWSRWKVDPSQSLRLEMRPKSVTFSDTTH